MHIGFYSSSTPITAISQQRFKRAKKFLAAKGVSLTAGSLTKKSDFYRSGTIRQRANEINELIYNPEIDVIMSTIGGTNTNSILPYIDYEYLKHHPKTFVGYSDTTALLLAIKKMAPTCRVLYGPALVASFGESESFVEETWAAFYKVYSATYNTVVELTAPRFWSDDQANWEEYEHQKIKKVNAWHAINCSTLEGRVIGGNLNTIYGILASKYFPDLTNDNILFIEDAEKDAATIEKNFAMLKNADIFTKVKGIVLGKHALFDDLGSKKQPIDILQEVLNDTTMPIIYNYDSCHTIPMLTTPLGARAIFNATKMKVEFSDF